MGSGLAGAMFVLFLVVAVGIAVLAVVSQSRRRRALAAWALASGWQYTDSDDSLVALSTRAPFGVGRARHAREVLRGRFSGRDAVSFAYTWRTGSGKDEQTHTVHVVALALPAYLPVVEVEPENVVTRMAHAFGGEDLQFEFEEFNRAFRVRSDDRRIAYAVLHPRLMERLLRGDARECAWRTDGTWILSWAPGASDLGSMAARFGVLSAVVASIPRHVWQEHGYDPLVQPIS